MPAANRGVPHDSRGSGQTMDSIWMVLGLAALPAIGKPRDIPFPRLWTIKSLSCRFFYHEQSDKALAIPAMSAVSMR